MDNIFNGNLTIVCPRCKSKNIFCFHHLDNPIQDIIPPAPDRYLRAENDTTWNMVDYKVIIRS